MAVIFLSSPGTEYGPCNGNCQHADCAQTRAMALAGCSWCGEAIGYNRHFYSESENEGKLIHAHCLDEKIEKEG